MVGLTAVKATGMPVVRCLTTVLGVSVLFACSHHVPAPVVNLSSYSAPAGASLPSQAEQLPDFHIVEPGDTLFSIAWRYGVDYRQLAEINEVGGNFRIYPGQKISFALPQKPTSAEDFDPQGLKVAVREALGLPIQSEVKSSSNNNAKHRVSERSPQIAQSSVKSPKEYKKRTKSTRQVAGNSGKGQVSTAKVGQWHWPVKGEILERFSKELHGNKGLDISAKPGEPVRAAAPGRVVYSGNALKGYGNLVIVKHNDDYLSAYAHNSKIHVQENEIVKAGQVIADIGNSGTDQSKLHFEIRYRGKPVDPIKYLPKL